MSATYIPTWDPVYGRGDIVVPLIHLALAVGVTIHVLLTKREAGSSVSWIGLAWLAPILGSVLYLADTVGAAAVKIDAGIADPDHDIPIYCYRLHMNAFVPGTVYRPVQQVPKDKSQ